jgi:soluble epoxide hydrolase / lipid-phosphate phosphatase
VSSTSGGPFDPLEANIVIQGSPVAQRFYNFHADRCSGVILINVAYIVPNPDEPFDLDSVLKQTEAIFGYGVYWYWKLFTAPDGPEIMDNNLESFWAVAHGEPETWLDTFCKPDGMRNFLLNGKTQPTMAYATEARKQTWLASRKLAPGFDAPLNYYRAMKDGVQDRANKNIPKENVAIKVPFLFFGGQRDYVCRPELMGVSLQAGLIPDCTQVVVDSGHWAHLDKSKEFGEAVTKWLREKF